MYIYIYMYTYIFLCIYISCIVLTLITPEKTLYRLIACYRILFLLKYNIVSIIYISHMGKKQKYRHIRVADLLRIFIFLLSIRHISAADSCISRSLSAEMDYPEV